MRERLSSLSEEARSIRSQVPSEFHPDVERIQQQMQRLGERLAELTGASKPLDDVRRAQPDEVILLGAPHRAENPWDQDAANALTRFYESGEAFYGKAPDNDAFVEIEVEHAEAAARMLQAPAPRRVNAPAHAATTHQQQSWRGEEPSGVEPAWLDERFADIARRIEEALAEIRPESSLQQLGNRFDLLEARMSAVLSNVATRADLKELRVAEEQIEDIGKQLGQLRRQLERLDAIDAHLGTLTEHLSDEHFLRILNKSATHDDERLQAIDAQLATIGQQLAHDRFVESAEGREAMEAHSRDLGEMRGLIESLIHERRHHDENNASMLETMQQAIIRVLDRLDAMELGQQGAAPSEPTTMPPADSLVPPTAKVVAAQRQQQPIQQPPQPMPYQPSMQAETPQPSMEEMPATAEDEQDEPEEQAERLEPDSEYQIPRSSLFARKSDEATAEQQPPFVIAPFDMDSAFARSTSEPTLPYGGSETPAKAIDPSRHDFIADAHRAKLKAAAKVDAPTEADQARAGEMGAALDKSLDKIKAGTIKPRPRRSLFRSPRALMAILTLLAMIPAALFFMPRVPNAEKVPATTNALPYYPDTAPRGASGPGNGAIAPLHPDPSEPVLPGDELPRKQSQRLEGAPQLEPGSYQDAGNPGSAGDYGHIDTASIPDSITFGSGAGVTSASVTPAEVMQEHLVRGNGGPEGANGPLALPPATVGPYSLRLAAARGDASAQFEVASRLADDKSSDKNVKEALEWYQRSAAAGFAMAQFRLGTLYERGVSVKSDLARAQVWYMRAAEQGNVKAMHNLAVLIASRSDADYKLAGKWFSEAAARGLPDSQFNLAVLYQNGLGVEKDLKQAYKWLILAARSGDNESIARRDALKTLLSDTERAAAEAMAESWRITPSDPVANNFRAAGQAWQYGPSTIASRN